MRAIMSEMHGQRLRQTLRALQAGAPPGAAAPSPAAAAAAEPCDLMVVHGQVVTLDGGLRS